MARQVQAASAERPTFLIVDNWFDELKTRMGAKWGVPRAVDRLASALTDRYHVERELGQGGMATVYLAEDVKHHRRVALKVLRPSCAPYSAPSASSSRSGPRRHFQHPHILAL